MAETDLLLAPEAKAKKKRGKKKRARGMGPSPAAKPATVHVNVSVVNSAGDSKGKKSNEADDALARLRGF